MSFFLVGSKITFFLSKWLSWSFLPVWCFTAALSLSSRMRHAIRSNAGIAQFFLHHLVSHFWWMKQMGSQALFLGLCCLQLWKIFLNIFRTCFYNTQNVYLLRSISNIILFNSILPGIWGFSFGSSTDKTLRNGSWQSCQDANLDIDDRACVNNCFKGFSEFIFWKDKAAFWRIT